ncbi:MAG: serine hydrolase family protein [Candidatus Aenigmatarchaeota archaeon]|nr:MAG: serine hydrolase family protein [Candidatus Aenigmarchaeota archaeon]
MTNIIIIHGAYGHPNENWFPWLKSELEKLGCRVFIPKFPTPENQSLKNWLKVFENYKQYLNENSIVVGHSLGPVFLLNILEKLDKPIKAAFFVSGFVGLLGNPNFDNINKTFVDKNFDWQKIKQNCKKFYIFHSDNDPYVPLEKAKELAKNLDVDIILVKNAGHFNEKAGYTKFELLLKKIKNEL